MASGAFAFLIASIIEGNTLDYACNEMLEELEPHEEISELVKKAVLLTKTDIAPADPISILGDGRIAEEALAISLYCSLKYREDFKSAIITAVNHDGDSDSTGAITGNIVGAYLGVDSIPNDCIGNIELGDVIKSRLFS